MCAVLLLVVAPLTAESTEQVIRIGGTGGALGSIREVAAAFQKKHPGTSVTIPASLGSSGGIKALLAGAIDIAVSSRLPNEEERKQGAVEQEYGRTPFIFVATLDGPAPNLSLHQIAAMYAGEFKTWPDGTPVRLVLRAKGDTDNQYLMDLSGSMDKAVRDALRREGMTTAVTDQDNLDAIQRIRGGFGASTLAQVITEKRQVAVVVLNGVAPSVHTLRSRDYPYYKSFFAITGPRTSSAARSFLDFLKSEEGRAILGRTGHIPGPFAH